MSGVSTDVASTQTLSKFRYGMDMWRLYRGR
jgi:hypothetical protein